MKILYGTEPAGQFEVHEVHEDFTIIMRLANGERVTSCVTCHKAERLERIWATLRQHGFTNGAPEPAPATRPTTRPFVY